MHRTWQELEAHYLDAIDYAPNFADVFKAMADLCSGIISSDLSSALYGHTSCHTLYIYQVDQEYPIHYSSQKLEISPNLKTRKIEFRFIDTPIEKKQWRRIENPIAQTLIDRLVGFINQVGWMQN